MRRWISEWEDVTRPASANAPPALVVSSHRSADRLAVVLVGDVLHPCDVLAIERFMDRDMDHAGGRGCAMPMLLARRDPDHVAGLDLTDRASLACTRPTPWIT